MQPQETFKRYEKKYLLNTKQIQKFLPVIEEHMQLDEYGRHTICNIYFDTDNFELIRTSIEKPVYKEKVRLRSYGVPSDEDMVFLELKKKFDKIVYKRRAPMTLKQADAYLDFSYAEKAEEKQKGQIQKELDFVMEKYHLKPAVYLSYERMAYFGKEQPELRVTFDANILCRTDKLDLREGSFGTPLLEESQLLMEIKIPGTMPLWLSQALSENAIFPFSYSKYGTYYKRYILPEMSFGDKAVQGAKSSENMYRKNQFNHRRVTC